MQIWIGQRKSLSWVAGTGWLAKRLLAGQLPENARYHGIDLSPTMAQITLERLAEYSNRVDSQSVRWLPAFDIPDQSMDCFISTYVLDILSGEDIQTVISEAHRMLKRMVNCVWSI
ncbi:MAG: class I SAM-dependent methyltransferase [Candidatus Moduliflexus flocculans]|nr:class I SAM-dependent methyltransferase [Candidatus Moduliflexus flocculans]